MKRFKPRQIAKHLQRRHPNAERHIISEASQSNDMKRSKGNKNKENVDVEIDHQSYWE